MKSKVKATMPPRTSRCGDADVLTAAPQDFIGGDAPWPLIRTPTIPYTYPTLRQSRRKMCVDI
jgi:hypothetical protein